MDRRIKRTKTAIYNAVAQLLLEKEANKVTVLELCKRADINKSTFYLHYNNIEDCLKDCFDVTMNGVIEIAKKLDYATITANPAPMVDVMLDEVEKNLDYICKFKESGICASGLRMVKKKMAMAICEHNNINMDTDYEVVMKIYYCIGGCADTLLEPLPNFNKEKLRRVLVSQLSALS